MKLLDNKYMIAAVVVIMLVFVYFMWKRRSGKIITSGKGKRSKTGKSGKSDKSGKSGKASRTEKKSRPETQSDPTDTNEETEDADGQDTAQELYNLVHDRMSSGMQSDEFLEVAGDLGDNLTYIEIKQLYNDAKNKGQDPSKSVNIDDYSAVLDKRTNLDE